MQKHPPKAPERRNFSFEFERHIHWLVCQKWFEIFLQGVILVNVGTLALQRAPIPGGEREYTHSGRQSQKGRENIRFVGYGIYTAASVCGNQPLIAAECFVAFGALAALRAGAKDHRHPKHLPGRHQPYLFH
eukprot:5898683-Pyramimonas_sp.AAC.1